MSAPPHSSSQESCALWYECMVSHPTIWVNGEPLPPNASMHDYKSKLQNLPTTTLTLLCRLSTPVTTALWVSYQASQYNCLGGRLTLPPHAAVLNQQVATLSVKTKLKNNSPIDKLRTPEPPVHKDAKTRASRIKA